ncbi:6-phospho-3-hexuloisomerase [Candidatus Bathyarchaeota archaeon]|nr:6-phospho-3-hexuloisomerase [Candidatus Bathyarchaeota archaeon]
MIDLGYVKEISGVVLSSIKEIIDQIDEREIEEMVQRIIESRDRKILLLGSGRSGFVGKAFALRLMHLGFNIYVSGETITPALSPEDLVIAISGSGVTRTVVTQAEVAKEIGAKVIAITSHPDSPLAKVADSLVIVKGRSKIDVEPDYERRQIIGKYDPTPLGTMFELSAMVFLDCVIAELMRRLGVSELDLRKKHATVE